MGVVAELGRLAVGAWSPGGAGGGYIAVGSYAGSADPSLSNGASLELMSVDIQHSKLVPIADVPSPDKFCSIDWAIPSRAHPAGLIAGGLGDGTVRVWDAATLIRSSQGRTDENTGVLFGGPTAQKMHTAPVRALAFNPNMPTRLATGSADGQILVWDLANPSAGPAVRPPAKRQTASHAGLKEEITATAWNRRVPHILATATSSSTVSIWDLKKGSWVIDIRNPRGRLRCSSLAWHPENATQIVVCCEEDEFTGAVLYDLRNSSSPILSYPHHGARGVVSSHWCPHDSDLLLTSSRDSRTVAVSVSSGDIVSEAPQTAKWNFDVKWSPRIPGLYLASAFDGRITINSLMTSTTAPSVSSETVHALAESFGEMADGFQSNVSEKSPRAVEAQRVSYNVTRPPKWLQKPVSMSFGFGGVRASFSSKDTSRVVTIESYHESFPGLSEGPLELDKVLMDVTSENPAPAREWCEKAAASAETPREKMAWDGLALMFQTDCRRKVLQYLGFELPPPDAGDEISMPVYGLSRSQPLAVPVRPAPLPAVDIPENKIDATAAVGSLANGASAMNLDGPAPWEVSDPAEDDVNVKDSILDGDDTVNGGMDGSVNKPNGTSLEAVNMSKGLASKSRSEIESLIKRSVIVGDFKAAVEACMHVGRSADALLIAYAGGPDLWLKTQTEYLSQISSSEGSSIVGAVAGPKSKMDTFVCEAAEAGKESWKEALAVVLTYSAAEDISASCSALGQRLLVGNDPAAALFCFICAGNTRMATTVWMRERPSTVKTTSVMMSHRIERLTELVQRVRLVTAATALCNGEPEIGAVRALDEVSGSILCEYGALLAVRGNFSQAVTYLNNLDPTYSCVYGPAGLIQAQALESLSVSDTAQLAPVQQTNDTATSNYDPYGTSYSGSYQNQSYSGAAQGYEASGHQQNNAAWGAPPPAAVPPPPPAPLEPTAAYNGLSEGVNTVQAPSMPAAPALTPPRPGHLFGSTSPTGDRSIYDPSSAYVSAPTYSQSGFQQAPGVVTPPAPMGQYDSTMHSAPPPPMPAVPTPPMQVAPIATGGGSVTPPMPSPHYGSTMPSAPVADFAAPAPPPPPTDELAPPPTSYHARAKPGSGASLPPSAEVAVAETRRSKPPSSSGMPGGPPRRSGSTSSSLSALGSETVFLDKADVSKVPGDQQVIVKSLRGAYMYAQGLNQSPRYKKKMDDVSKRLGRLVAGLNARLIEGAVVNLLIEVGNAIQKGNYDQASAVVTTLTKQHWESNSQWIQGLKRLIDCVLTGR
eukprot:GFKZ01004558.1.p1 GENE.GFKZ01004558.1~~GFKZ01004558.1.p1  ORF type:complete len:1272 (+),score=154.97 GFKZ01004558.1:212-4027(+)